MERNQGKRLEADSVREETWSGISEGKRHAADSVREEAWSEISEGKRHEAESVRRGMERIGEAWS